MEDCSKTSAGTVAAIIPDDVLVEIFSRVPAKSVCRFKCVSKAWRDLIADQDHRKKLRQAMQGLFFMTFETVHFCFGFMDLTAGSSDVDPSFSFLTEQPGNHNLVLLDSCNGLFLFGHQRQPPYYEDLGYIVCNPTTKKWEAVPTCGSPQGVNDTYLAFDPAVSSNFHLVQFQKTDMKNLVSTSVHAYSSETGTWSHRLKDKERHNQTDEEEEQGLSVGWGNDVHRSQTNRCAFVNGFLHLIVWVSKKQLIVVVDVQGRPRRMIGLPNVRANWGCIYVGQSQGFLHCITRQVIDFYGARSRSRYELSIWVLQDYDAEEWVLKDTVSSFQLFGEKCHRSLLDSEVADIHLDCNVVFFFSTCERKFIAYEMDRKKVSVFDTCKSVPINRLKVGRYVPCFSESPAPFK